VRRGERLDSGSWKPLPLNVPTRVQPSAPKTGETTQLGPSSCSPSDWPDLSRRERIDLLRGILAQLKEATPAGRQYLISKVLPLLRRETFVPGGGSDLADPQMIRRSMEQLEREASRVAPDPHVFDQTAWLLVDELGFDIPPT
jgi:hypothetical protein